MIRIQLGNDAALLANQKLASDPSSSGDSKFPAHEHSDQKAPVDLPAPGQSPIRLTQGAVPIKIQLGVGAAASSSEPLESCESSQEESP